MKDSDRYIKIVAWSEEDGCYVDQVPGLFFGGCHGDDEKAVYAELCEIVDEVIEMQRDDGDPLPPPTSLSDMTDFFADHELRNTAKQSPSPKPRKRTERPKSAEVA
jgi:predicted RNase H-like HicB family nuclease